MNEVTLCLLPELGDSLITKLDNAMGTLPQGGVLAVLHSTPLENVASFPGCHIVQYVCRPISGSIITETSYMLARIAALHDHAAGGSEAFYLWIGSNEGLPDLAGGIFETGDESASDAISLQTPTHSPTLAYDDHSSSEILEPAIARAEALGQRLLRVDERTFELRRRLAQLEAQQGYAGQSGGGQGFFDVPRTQHAWPLAQDQDLMPEKLDLYDRRVDDDVVLEGRKGQTFFSAFALESEKPDYDSCIEALNKTVPEATILTEGKPDVSIVIPVYGQLPYTLNCIESLFLHRTRYSIEIIIIDDCGPDKVTAQYIPQISKVRYHRQAVNGGFINSCNCGGDLAHGKFVLMLNNDTRVVENWLDALVETFDLFPNVGLVGSKMCYADGSLQEAGGILWRDGSAWNYGRNDDPNRPQYCHARQVDYISGCSLLLKTSLWNELQGFDKHYTPAYAEDADLCLRVAAAGYEVWFQPQSRVVHYEGKTGGTNTTSGTKAYQVTNLKKLFLRWREELEDHRPNAEAPYFERERKARKRILVIDSVTPTPNQDAGSVQTVLALRCARLLNYKTYFVPEDNWLFEPAYTPALMKEGIECGYAPFDVKFENYIRRYGWMFDIVLAYRVSVLERTHDLIRQYAPQAVLLYHVADLHYLRTEREAQLEGNQEKFREATLLKQKELNFITLADCTITHSTTEAEILSQELPDARVTVWPLMFDFFGTKSKFSERRDICFLGGYRHPPNVDAVKYFVKELFPLLREKISGIRFIIAGANPSHDVLALASSDVVVTGMVEDLREVFDKSRIFVCPLRVGAGAKGKIMSALSYGIPIVSTSVGVEGAGLQKDKHVLVADTAEDIIRDIVRLYNDEALWNLLSKNGQALMQEEFSTGMGIKQLKNAIDMGYRHKLGLA
ncbi:glycosyltransferase [Acidocella aminolytica]|nr:glycosyltransferase [Acidocella aminolytica]